MKSYDHKKIEKKWQEIWAKNKIYTTPDQVPGKDNFYLLVEFPYPSGNLHVGHWYAFALPDILARKLRMQGKNVLYPIGFDAFGLPAENAAIKNKLNPRDWTQQNITYMKKQIESMGASFDWSRQVSTINPNYYRWTQWLFLQLYKSNLVYRKETMVNWCPNDKTVLANEQVVDGKCERCGHEVVQKEMLQWNIKITDYADRLIDDLEKLNWPEPIKESQRNWIGRSEGAEIDFPLEFERNDAPKPNYLLLHGYTGRADKNFIPWLKKELEKNGFQVQAPQMPNTDAPKESEQVEYVINNCPINEYTIIVGHSLGAIVAMKALQRSKQRIAGLVIVAAAAEPSFKPEDPRPFWKNFTWDFDYDLLKDLTGFRIVLSDTLEKEYRGRYLEHLSSALQAPLYEYAAKRKHYTGAEEPFILSNLLPHLTVFTTRPDTLFGATYLVLAPEHPWVTLALQHKTVLKNNDEVAAYVEQAKKKTELERQTDQKEKTGVKLEGVEAINPAIGKNIPIFVADYILSGYGTGAIMAVPAHDERDFEFAKKFDLPIRYVVIPRFIDEKNPHQEGKETLFRKAVIAVIWDSKKKKYLGLKWKMQPWTTFVMGGIEEGESAVDAARREIEEETGYTKLKLVRVLGGPVQAEFYAAHKGVNRVTNTTSVLFEVTGESIQKEVSAEEKEKYETIWIDPSETTRANMTHAEIDLIMERVRSGKEVFEGEGVLIDSAEFGGLSSADAKKTITEKFGRAKKSYRLRDWIVSRQRYWGVPIPIVHCEKCGAVAVPDDQLPVLLPEVEDYLPEGSGKSPLAKVQSFVQVKCPQCGGDAKRETDTLDTFVDSSWYFLRYTDPKNADEFASKEKMNDWMPVDLYSGGAEHTTMHLLYSRFWQKALFDCGLVKDSEPYARRMNRSIILGPDGQKMSKSRGNVIDPDEVVKNLGADTVRMYLAFIGPYNEVSNYPWNPDGVVGVRRFLERAWRLSDQFTEKKSDALERLLHKTVKKVGEDIEALKFNTAIAAMMVFVNAAEKECISKDQFARFLKILAPFAPHMAEELWHELGNNTSIHLEAWPKYDGSMLEEEEFAIAIQIDGKARDEIRVSSSANKAEIEKAAREKVASRLEGKIIVRTIVVPNRLVNFVTS